MGQAPLWNAKHNNNNVFIIKIWQFRYNFPQIATASRGG